MREDYISNKDNTLEDRPPCPEDRELSTEERILRAAEHEFLTKGFSGARTTSIAAAAGVTHAMLHYYFRTKDNLYERIIAAKIAILSEGVISSVRDLTLSLDDMIYGIISRHLEFVSSNPDLPRFIISEIYTHPDRAMSLTRALQENAPKIIAGIQSKIDAAVSDGTCRQVDAATLMLDIVSLNIFPYVAMPVVNAALGNCMDDKESFLERRKKENFDTIMRKLRP